MRVYSHYPPYELDVVSGRVMAGIDRTAIEIRGIPGLFLMEQAGLGVAQGLMATLPASALHRTVIFCGKGNNGGDGFVIARHLAKNGHSPLVALIGHKNDLQGDARTNCSLLCEDGIPLWECTLEEELLQFLKFAGQATVWIDALLGTGARGAARGLIARAISALNEQSRSGYTISVDIPSGVEADTGNVEGEAVYADWVYTMGLPKIGSLLPPGLNYGKRLIVLDIGFPRDLLSHTDSPARLLTAREIDRWLPKRSPSTHKGSEGHVLVVAGSKGMTGAALMSAQAAIHSGAGLVTAACPASLLPIYASSIWEMMTLPVCETEIESISIDAFDSLFPVNARWSAVIIGPGLGRHPSTQDLVRKVVREVQAPLVIDGDALAAIKKEELQERQWAWVATPHPGEMARLFDTTVSAIQSDRLGYARRLVETGQGVAVLKGAKTVIAAPESKTYINPTGTPAMASGGMGDVLTGVVGAFLAKGIPAVNAAACGVFLHGLAAEMVEEQNCAEAVSATDVISFLQTALHHTRQWSQQQSVRLGCDEEKR